MELLEEPIDSLSLIIGKDSLDPSFITPLFLLYTLLRRLGVLGGHTESLFLITGSHSVEPSQLSLPSLSLSTQGLSTRRL